MHGPPVGAASLWIPPPPLGQALVPMDPVHAAAHQDYHQVWERASGGPSLALLLPLRSNAILTLINATVTPNNAA